MPIQIQWYDEDKHIIRYQLQDSWTSAEFCDAVRWAVAQTKGYAPVKVHSMVDTSETNNVPPDFFSQVSFLRAQVQPNSGLITIVRSPGIFTNILRLMLPLLPNIRSRVRMVDSIEEAENLIRVAQIATGEVERPTNWSQFAS